MEFKELASLSGKGGLFKVLKPTRTGVILESIDNSKTKIVTGPHHRVSLLSEISIYTNDVNKNIPIEDILKKIHKEFNGDIGIDSKSDKAELFSFMKEIEPEFDQDRVYPSDIKKIISWYEILNKSFKEILEEKKKSPAKKTTAKKSPTKQTNETKSEN